MNGDFTFNITGNLHDEADRKLLCEVVRVVQEWNGARKPLSIDSAPSAHQVWSMQKGIVSILDANPWRDFSAVDLIKILPVGVNEDSVRSALARLSQNSIMRVGVGRYKSRNEDGFGPQNLPFCKRCHGSMVECPDPMIIDKVWRCPKCGDGFRQELVEPVRGG